MTNMIDWHTPETFNPETPGLGLPPLAGVKHTLLYDPLPSSCGEKVPDPFSSAKAISQGSVVYIKETAR
jgi:hypothetical protein